MSHLTVFVCGVTGTQGGAVARHLLSNSATVHAMVRNASSPNAVTMRSLGVTFFPGDYNDEATLKSAMQGCNAAFLNLNPTFAEEGGELRLAKSIISAAKAAGVKHFIYTSSPAVNAPEQLSHWDPNSRTAKVLLSKQSIERATASAGFEYWTLLRPGNFMANFVQPLVQMHVGLVDKGHLTTAFERTTLLPTVDPDTIGAFACTAFLNPEKFNKAAIELADEFLTTDQVLAKLSSATGRDLKAVYLSQAEIDAQKATNPMIVAQLAMRDMTKFVDLDKVKSWGIPLSSFDAYVEREKEKIMDTYVRTSDSPIPAISKEFADILAKSQVS